MKLSQTMCFSVVVMMAFTAGDAIAGTPLCNQGFWISNVKGTPRNEYSSYVCTTKVISCPAPNNRGTTQGGMSNQTSKDVNNHTQAQFSYQCNYGPPA